jgi:hypothetical protein
VHYNALFERGEREEKTLNAEFAEAPRKDLRKQGEEKYGGRQDQTLGPPEGGSYDFR